MQIQQTQNRALLIRTYTVCHSSKSVVNTAPNGYVATAGGVQETELNAQTKHCSASVKSRSRSVTVNGSGQGAGCIIADVCMKFHWLRSLGVLETQLNAQTKPC